MTKELTINQYATKRNISSSAVQSVVKYAYETQIELPYGPLPNVAKITKIERFYLLDVEMKNIPKGRTNKYTTRLQK